MSRRGDWILTFSGVEFWPLDPRPEDVRLVDVAHSLSNLCRFTGHVRRFYSVAEHSCRVHDLLEQWRCSLATRRWGLLHDAPEAYLGDLARPTKHSSAGFGDAYRLAERRVQAAVMARFGLPEDEPAAVKRADDLLLATEVRDLMPPHAWSLDLGSGGLPELILDPWTPDRAFAEFWVRAAVALGLTGGMGAATHDARLFVAQGESGSGGRQGGAK